MSGYISTYTLTMCNPKIYTSDFVAISIFMRFLFSLEIVPLHKNFFSRYYFT
jgi:hypothetical protein